MPGEKEQGFYLNFLENTLVYAGSDLLVRDIVFFDIVVELSGSVYRLLLVIDREGRTCIERLDFVKKPPHKY